ncbi:MAG: aldo/keto reductase, partial [Planctomycetota bacterium]|nr:aldo/keto reductase [Planctomycetota bacterium]
MHLTHALLGDTGLRVSPLGLGTVKFGRSSGVKYPTPVTIPDDAAAAGLLAKAMSLGINLIDTAPAYGTSEARLGVILKGQRDRWVICTKVGETFENDRSTFDFSPGAI